MTLTLDAHSEIVAAPRGVLVEIATMVHEGREFANLGAVVDHKNGFACAYPDGKGHVTTWNGVVLGTARIVRRWKQFVPGAHWRVEMFAWSCRIEGKGYYGRNGGPCMALKLRANKH